MLETNSIREEEEEEYFEGFEEEGQGHFVDQGKPYY
jgi:hypothetical protein